MNVPTPRQPPVPAGYTLLRELGEGRSGSALLCRDDSGSEIVIRALTSAPTDSRPAVESELRALAAAGDHACAVRINRVWTDPGVGVCLEQEFCPGGPLAASGAVPQASALVGTSRLATALAHLHAHGVLHQDVRPANVLVDASGEWRLADAGIAAALGLSPDSRSGRPRELLGWESPGPSADVYGLGTVLQSALTGRPAAGADAGDPAGPLPAGTPPILAGLLARMLAADPAERPALTEIDQVLRSLVPEDQRHRLPSLLPTRPPGALPKPRVKGLADPPPAATARRRGVLIAAGAAVLFFVGAGAVVATNGGGNEDGAQLAGSVSLASPSATPRATPVTVPSPAPKKTVTPKPRSTSGSTRGTSGLASGPDVVAGLKPRQILAFVYRGRLAVLFDFERISAKVQRWEIMSARPDGSGARLGDDQGDKDDEVAPVATPRRTVYFFGPDVSPRRCVQVRIRLDSGRLVPDNRTVCPAELTNAQDRVDADAGWKAYLEYLEAKEARKATRRST